jgi:predicted GIY-YIG superfamily endonuclease/proteasome lid subunit RPN8/RPN11
MSFWAYMLHCRGGVFYTGHTDDLERRVAEHESGHFPGFTSELRPVHLVWSEEFPTRDEAKAAEKRIKGWSRKKKLALIRGDWAEISRLAKSKSGLFRLAGQASRSGQTSTSSRRTGEPVTPSPPLNPPVLSLSKHRSSFAANVAPEEKNGPSTSSGQTDLVVRWEALERIQSEARAAHPLECCGLLLGRGGKIEHARPAANVAAEPSRHFEIDPQALVDAHRAARAGGPPVVGYYHSHPGGPAAPSATDHAQAAHDGSVWAIAGASAVTFWRDEEAGFVPLSYAVEDG